MSDRLEVAFTDECRAELRELPRKHRSWIAGVVKQLQAKGWNAAVTDRTLAPLDDGIWELRIRGHGAAYRILLFVMPGRSPRVIVLTLCLAKSESQKMRVLKSAIARAARRRQVWIQQEAKHHGR